MFFLILTIVLFILGWFQKGLMMRGNVLGFENEENRWVCLKVVERELWDKIIVLK